MLNGGHEVLSLPPMCVACLDAADSHSNAVCRPVCAVGVRWVLWLRASGDELN